MTSHGIYWRADEARVKSFSAASGKAGVVIKIELQVTDPLRLGMLLDDLARAQRDQDKPVRPDPSGRPIPVVKDVRVVGRAPAPLQLTDGRSR